MKVVSQPSIFRFYVSLGSTDHQNSSKQILAEMFSLLKLSKWKISHQDRLPSQKSEPEMYVYIYLNPNDLCFDWKRPCFGGLKPQNRGQTGSRCIYIYMCVFFKNTYIYCFSWLKTWEMLGFCRLQWNPTTGKTKKHGRRRQFYASFPGSSVPCARASWAEGFHCGGGAWIFLGLIDEGCVWYMVTFLKPNQSGYSNWEVDGTVPTQWFIRTLC